MYFSARTEGRISYGHLGRTDSCFILLTLICIALEAGEVEVTLSHFSALLPYVFPVLCRHLVHFDLPAIRFRLITFSFFIRLSLSSVHQTPQTFAHLFV